MNRSRFLPVFSAMLGSTSAFVVLTRWGLLGTLAGAVMFPVVYTLASTGSKAGMERIGKWTDARRRNNEGTPETEQSEPTEASKSPTEAEQSEVILVKSPSRLWTRTLRRLRVQWPIIAMAVVSLGVSVYALTQADLGETVVIRETVIEKTVTSEVPRKSLVYITVPAEETPSADTSVDQTTTTVEGVGGEDEGDVETSSTTDTTLSGDEPTSTTLPPPTTSTTSP